MAESTPFVCTGCGHQINVPAAYLGKNLACRRCGAKFRVTRPAEEPETTQQPRAEDPSGTKKCPFCAEEIRTEAIICRFCNGFVSEYTPAPPAVHSSAQPLGARPTPKQPAPAKQKPSCILVFGGGFLALCVILAIFGPIFCPQGTSERRQPQREARQPTNQVPNTSKPPGTTNGGHVACLSKEWLDDMGSFVAQGDKANFKVYIDTHKCLILKDGLKVAVTSRGFLTTEFVFNGVKFYTPAEAINY